MTEHDATEVAYKNGYSAGREHGICEVISTLLKAVNNMQDLREKLTTEEMKCYTTLVIQIYLDIIADIKGELLQ